MACGDKFRHLAVTANGDSLDNPYGAVPEANDYTAWKERAREIALLVRDHLYALYDVDASAYNGMIVRHNAIVKAYDDLPEESFWWMFDDRTRGITSAINVVTKQLCLLEVYENAITKAGGTPPELPGGVTPTPPGIADTIGTVAVVAAGVVVVALLLRRR